MKSIISVLSLLVLISSFACASPGGQSNADKRKQIAMQEVASMMQPSKKLSGFASYELAPFTMSPAVSENEKKVLYVKKLEGMFRTKMTPMLDQWRSSGQSGSGILRIESEISSLKIVSGGARFWAGAWAGNSTITMNLTLIDQDTGEVLARPRVERSSNSMAGAWSIGATDQNLLNYIVDIAHQYFVENY